MSHECVAENQCALEAGLVPTAENPVLPEVRHYHVFGFGVHSGVQN